MRYEIFLRGTGPLPDAALEQMRAHADAVDLSLDLYRKPDDGEVVGVDLGADPDLPGAAGKLCTAAFALASEHRMTLFDPQLGRTVTSGDEEIIAQQLAQNAAFGLAVPVTPVAEGEGKLSPTLRLWLLVIGLMLVAFLLVRGLSYMAR